VAEERDAIIPVAIALVPHQGCYLVGRRGPDGPLAGYFEFPGGKCQPDEPPEICAVRECREETGLDVEVLGLRHKVVHDYPYGKVDLHFFDCRLVTGAPVTPLPGNFYWVPAIALRQLQFPEPNRPLIDSLTEGGSVR
jgi:mutator protein MutT